VGGDYYDVIWINEVELVFCLADVSGKGVAAALLMSNLQAALRVLLKYTQNLTEIVIDINQLICDNAKGEKFISLFIAKYNIGTRKLSYINAGHNSPILLNNNQIISLNKGCTLLGISNPLHSLEADALLVSPHSILFAYTDGLTDTVNSNDDVISIEEIKTILINNKLSNCAFINKAMLYYLEEFKGEMPFIDDIAMLTCKFN
jgi:sigma-B regulation protein RsbU (phosphoserine phosphatase)